MLRSLSLAALALIVGTAPLSAAGITGKYIEARTCDVWTGPCFANAEMGMGGKHAVLGWIHPTTYYAMQELHRILPELVEGGYRIKQAMWGFSVQVIGTDIELPIGEGLPIAMAAKMALSLKDGNQLEALKWAAMLALPYGDIVALWTLANEALALVSHPPVHRPPIIGPIRPIRPIQPIRR